MLADGIYISDLPTLEGAVPNTSVVAVDDGTTTKQATTNQVAKAVVENYTGSSLAGTAQSIKSAIDSLGTDMGDLSDLDTTDKSSLVNAINEVATTPSVSPYDTDPEMDGTASPGESDEYARGDHVHPSDTSKADTDGMYEDMSVGNLISTQFVENKEPYLFRRTGNGKNIDGSEKAFIDKIIGGTVAWNQLIGSQTSFRPSQTSGGITYTSNGDGTFTLNGTATTSDWWNVVPYSSGSVVAGHKYYICDANHNGGSDTFGLGFSGGTIIAYGNVGAIVSAPSNSSSISYVYKSGAIINNAIIKPMLIDLTALFGSAEIADYVYSLEQTTAGSGIAWLKAHGFIDGSYRAYDSGSLQSVKTSEHRTVGFNQWDEEWEVGGIKYADGTTYDTNDRIRSKSFYECIPNTSYYNKTPTNNLSVFWYDSNKNYINRVNIPNAVITSPTNAKYFKICLVDGTTYNHDICINLSDPSKNGQYEPYEVHSYPLDPNLELRGLFKLDANNNLYAEGDVYESSGAVTRKYGYRAYQSGDESLTDAITDGTNTVYKLTTPTTETAQPYASPQVVSPLGTEEYIDTRDVPVPVGHETKYMANLREKIEDLPWDLSMIAPIENGATASQAYAQGKYFLKDNQFCKALTSIASGATFTLNTNYAVTTVANELYTALHS